jgi:hypothetical protein
VRPGRPRPRDPCGSAGARPPVIRLKLPHDPAFAYRIHLLALALGGALLAAAIDPASAPAERLPDALAIVLVAAAGYAAMRVCMLGLRPLLRRWPGLVRGSGLAIFYGAIPAALLGLLAGTKRLGVPGPTVATLAFVVAGAAAVAAGAYAAVAAVALRSARGP